MGTVVSFDVRGGESQAVRTALEEAIAGLHRVDEVFSTYREGSQISRLARGEVTLEECDPEVAEVLALGAEAERLSDGWFSTRYEGRVDPTGIVKGWAVERAARRLSAAGASGVSVNGGGDVQLYGMPGSHRPWRVGVSDPLRPGGHRGAGRRHVGDRGARRAYRRPAHRPLGGDRPGRRDGGGPPAYLGGLLGDGRVRHGLAGRAGLAGVAAGRGGAADHGGRRGALHGRAGGTPGMTADGQGAPEPVRPARMHRLSARSGPAAASGPPAPGPRSDPG